MLINIEKMKSDNSFKVRLPEYVYEGFIQNVCDYFLALENDLRKIKPNEAVDVISVLTAFREYFNSVSEWEYLVLRSLDILNKGVSRSFFHNIASFSGMTHVAFTVNDLSVKAQKIKPYLQGINEILLDNLSTYLATSNRRKFNTAGNFEVIKGLSGPLRYLLSFDDDEQMKHMTSRIIDVLIERSEEITVVGHKISGWHYYPSEIEKSFMTMEALNGLINYGLSHGMGGPLVTLSLAHKNGIRKEGLEDAIDGLITEYMKASYYINDIVYWPGRITFEQYIGLEEIHRVPNQMSWCYGSVGILRVLYMSGVLMSNNKIRQFALNELLKIAKIELTDYLLSQSIVCHGFVGTAMIMNLMYIETGKNEFLKKTVEMLEITSSLSIERYFDNEKQVADERNISPRANLHTHLEGYNGIIQTTLSILKGIPNGNEKRLLIV